MKVAVYDTYVVKKDGKTMHFDVIVPEGESHERVLAFGREYLKSVGQEGRTRPTGNASSVILNQPQQKSSATINQIFEVPGIPASERIGFGGGRAGHPSTWLLHQRNGGVPLRKLESAQRRTSSQCGHKL